MGKKKKKKLGAIIGSAAGTVALIAGAVAYYVVENYGDDVGAAMITSSSDPGADWTGEKALRCGGNQNVVLKDRTLSTTKKVWPALILAGGNCTLRIVGCKLTGRRVISAGGNATVIVEASTITGKRAISVGGGAKLSLYDSVVKGKRFALSVSSKASIAYDAKTVIVGRKRGRKKRYTRLPDGATPP